MPNFTLLALEQTRESFTKKEPLFRWKVYHVKELFMAFLPKMEINNSSKIQLNFGIKGDEYEVNSVLGVTNTFVEGFDFEAFNELDIREQEFLILNIIVDKLCEISQRNGVNIEKINIIKETSSKVVEVNFDLTLHIKRLSKRSPNREYTVNVYRCLNSSCGESWRCDIKNNKSGEVVQKWMTKIPDYIYMNDFFKRVEITNTEYVIYNSFSEIEFQTSLENAD